MKVLLDENLTPKLLTRLPPNEVVTAVYAGFGGLTNGALLNAAEGAGFEVFLTGDRNIPHQQSLDGRQIAVVALTGHDWLLVGPHVEAILTAIAAATPGSLQVVDCGRFSRRKTLGKS